MGVALLLAPVLKILFGFKQLSQTKRQKPLAQRSGLTVVHFLILHALGSKFNGLESVFARPIIAPKGGNSIELASIRTTSGCGRTPDVSF
jgi:hypothetical protein